MKSFAKLLNRSYYHLLFYVVRDFSQKVKHTDVDYVERSSPLLLNRNDTNDATLWSFVLKASKVFDADEERLIDMKPFGAD